MSLVREGLAATALVCIALALPANAFASDKKQEPWLISPEERFAKWRELSQTQQAAGFGTNASANVVLRLNGSEHPHLMPQWRLFDYLVRNAFTGLTARQEDFRHRMDGRAAAMGYPEGLWNVLSISAAPLIENRKRQLELAKKLARQSPDQANATRAELETLAALDCGLRGEAFLATEVALGKNELGQLLYFVVAPEFHVTVFDSLEIEQEILAEGGCK